MNHALNYPPARKGGQVDQYFGTLVSDPYRWLEQPDTTETRSWVDVQIALSEGFLNKCPGREEIRTLLEQRLDFVSRSVPFRHGERLFFSKRTGLENHRVHMCIEPEGMERLLIDPNKLSDDGTVSLDYWSYSVSPDGNYLAYGISVAGSDWVEIHVRDINTGEDLVDCLRWTKFSKPCWSNDSSGFFYCRFDEPTDLQAVPTFHKCYFHKVGSTQREDELAFENNDEASRNWYYFPMLANDGRYLLLRVKASFAGPDRIYLKDLNTGEINKLIDEPNARWEFIRSEGSRFWFVTDFEAPQRRLVIVDADKSGSLLHRLSADRSGTLLDSLSLENRGGLVCLLSPDDLAARLDLQEVIPQPDDKRTVLKMVTVTGRSFFVEYSVNVQSVIKEFTFEGQFVRNVKHPMGGQIYWTQGGSEWRETLYTFQNYTTPETVYRYNIDTGESTLVFRPEVPIDESKYVTKLVFATTEAGMKVPMFISYRKGLKRNGKNASLKFGYGGFGISLGPNFSPERTVWMDLGGIYADAILPGGGEFGEEWHLAGAMFNKQAVFDAFIACSQWLIDNGYTCPAKNAIRGGSNGGLLVAACCNQRPQLFGAVLNLVGVLDMLRYDQFTAGPYWRAEYGSATADRAQFENLLAYSPLHNIQPGHDYPPTLISTADHDDRVVPAHSYKYGAALQAAQSGANPMLVRIERKAGHSAGKPLSMQINAAVDEFSFLVETLKIPRRKLRRLRQLAGLTGRSEERCHR